MTLAERFGDRAQVSESWGERTVDVAASDWIELLTYCRDTGYEFFDWLSGVDEPPDGFGVVAHVYNPSTHERLLLRTRVPRADPHLPSAVGVYRGANWHERETFEMFGVIFDDHPYLVPLLLPEGFEGYPLRKDFVLAARVAKAWPGAKEPGESGHGAPSRRKTLPPGVPAEWPTTPTPPSTPPASETPPSTPPPPSAETPPATAPPRAPGAPPASETPPSTPPPPSAETPPATAPPRAPEASPASETPPSTPTPPSAETPPATASPSAPAAPPASETPPAESESPSSTTRLGEAAPSGLPVPTTDPGEVASSGSSASEASVSESSEDADSGASHRGPGDRGSGGGGAHRRSQEAAGSSSAPTPTPRESGSASVERPDSSGRPGASSGSEQVGSAPPDEGRASGSAESGESGSSGSSSSQSSESRAPLEEPDG
ncbi:hypothetical protein GCM10010404_60490 [Nonomuraea africana]|uniref:NADH-quinone oxidoreductase subunit C n=1 Tax=Nonomuraea africana TaxID=46171 RepID=UPI00298ED882|nr:NADH-quinone oxidoreductase subunit C [Nonomuraea africana]